MKKFPTLYHKSKTGAIEVWNVWSDGPYVYTEYGQLDGKMQQSKKEMETVNAGKANERKASEQAAAVAQSMWKHKFDRKYSETLSDAKEPLFGPMLAKKFQDVKIKEYPVHIQPKLDGVRCFAYWDNGKIELMSRGGKPYVVPHVAEVVAKFLPKDSIFDGELYVHGLSCQTITSLVKKNRPESSKVKYWVYDYPSDGVVWEDRFAELCDIFKKAPDGHGKLIRTVRTDHANSEDEVWDWMKKYNEKGFEGAIVRLLGGLYEHCYRSSALLKVKEFQDDEYTVVGCTSGVGKFEKCAIFICKTKEGKTFNVTPKATQEEREAFLRNKAKYIGKKYTVRFFDLTDDGIPRFPVGIIFRDAADLPCAAQAVPAPVAPKAAKKTKKDDDEPSFGNLFDEA